MGHLYDYRHSPASRWVYPIRQNGNVGFNKAKASHYLRANMIYWSAFMKKEAKRWSDRDSRFFPAPSQKPDTATEMQKNMACDWGDPDLEWYDATPLPWVVSTPDTMLRMAVLEDAFRTLSHGDSEAKYLSGAYEETLAWVRQEYECFPGFSLADICDLLGMDTGYVKTRLLAIVPESTQKQIHFTGRRNITHRMEQRGYQAERRPRRRVSVPHQIQAKRERSSKLSD
jgi:hypothetical protein